MRRLTIWAFAMVFVGAAFHTSFVELGCAYSKSPSSVCLPGPQVSARLQRAWHEEVKAPLGIVAGNGFWMMDVGAFASDRPSMFTDFSSFDAPWITPQRLYRQGMLIVWGGGPAPAGWQKWIGDQPVHSEQFAWEAGRPPITISYVIVPPHVLGAPQ